MAQEYKYTTDGKKVVVIGDLNQTEKIVQEIFVTQDGDEIPQGERFVTKSLLDHPAKSWKEKNLEELEAKYDKEKAEWDRKISRLSEEKKLAYDSLSARVKWLRQVAKEPRTEEFKRVINTLADFLSGTKKWVAAKSYKGWELFSFDTDGYNEILDRTGRYGSVRFDQMRLLSLYGETNGSLVFRIDEYSDGSGQGKEVYFFKSYEEGISFLQARLDEVEEYTDYTIEFAKKYNLSISTEKLKTLKAQKEEAVYKQILEKEKELQLLKEKLGKIND